MLRNRKTGNDSNPPKKFVEGISRYAFRSLSLEDEMEILARILKHLNAEELREARLVSQDFNEVICMHPEVLWEKNRLFVNIHPHPPEDDANDNEAETELKWAKFLKLDLITRYNCPNFHFYKIDMASPGPQNFFQSLVPLHIKHLKMTGCRVNAETLPYILVRVTNSLEHLEMVNLSHFSGMTQINPPSWAALYFHYLRTVVLKSQSHEGTPCPCALLPLRFLHCFFLGAPFLKRISLTGWSSETCQNFLKILRSLPPDHVQSIQHLEISCALTRTFPFNVEQYLFIRKLESIKLPSLKTFVLRFDRNLHVAAGLTRELVEELTHSLASFLAAPAKRLEVLELINCPVSGSIFEHRMGSFPNLLRVDTRGTYVIELDWNDEDWNNNMEGNESIETSMDSKNLAEECHRSSIPLSSNSSQSDSVFRPILIYSLVFILFPIFISIYVLLYNWMLETYPIVGEISLMATIVCVLVGWLVQMWKSSHPR